MIILISRVGSDFVCMEKMAFSRRLLGIANSDNYSLNFSVGCSERNKIPKFLSPLGNVWGYRWTERANMLNPYNCFIRQKKKTFNINELCRFIVYIVYQIPFSGTLRFRKNKERQNLKHLFLYWFWEPYFPEKLIKRNDFYKFYNLQLIW